MQRTEKHPMPGQDHWFDLGREPAMFSDDGTAMHAWCFNCCRWELWKYARDQYGDPKPRPKRKRVR
jgi:hypothetical protein